MFLSADFITFVNNKHIYSIADDDFVEEIGIKIGYYPPSTRKLAAIILKYEQKKLNVAANVAIFVKLKQHTYYNFDNELYKKYQNEVEKYLLLL